MCMCVIMCVCVSMVCEVCGDVTWMSRSNWLQHERSHSLTPMMFVLLVSVATAWTVPLPAAPAVTSPSARHVTPGTQLLFAHDVAYAASGRPAAYAPVPKSPPLAAPAAAPERTGVFGAGYLCEN